MINKPKTFEKFFYKPDSKLVDIEKLNAYIEQDSRNINNYKGEMFCPECKHAELTYVNKTSTRRAYLKKIPSSKHYKNCSYNYEYARSELITSYFKNLNYNQVQDKLNAMMNMLFTQKVNKSNENISLYKENDKLDNPFLIPDSTKEQKNVKSLRRKKLQGWIDKSFENELYLFYGEVKLEVQECTSKKNENFKYYKVVIRTKNKEDKWKFRATVYRGNIKDDINKESIYQLVLIGKLDFSNKWPQINLINNDAIKYKLIAR